MQTLWPPNAGHDSCVRAGGWDGVSAIVHAGRIEDDLEAIPVPEINDFCRDEGAEQEVRRGGRLGAVEAEVRGSGAGRESVEVAKRSTWESCVAASCLAVSALSSSVITCFN